MLPTNTATPRALDIVSPDGRHLRRGYLELTIDELTASELTEEQRKHPGVLLTLYERRGGQEHEIYSRIFATTLPADISDDDRKTVILTLMNKLTDDLGVTAFTASLDIWDDVLEQFKRYAELLELAWFSKPSA